MKICLIFILVVNVLAGGPAVDGWWPNLWAADRYYVRVRSCDDGGKAFVNENEVINVAYNEDSTWLDITDDLAKGPNDIKFEVTNKTGAIAYVFQVKKNNRIVFTRSCGTVNVIGCENNRAFRIGVAREFTYALKKD